MIFIMGMRRVKKTITEVVGRSQLSREAEVLQMQEVDIDLHTGECYSSEWMDVPLTAETL